MTVLQVDHVTFGYGADLLFEDVSFSLALGERLALVAPNGQGKSTLLKIIAGLLPALRGVRIDVADALAKLDLKYKFAGKGLPKNYQAVARR